MSLHSLAAASPATRDNARHPAASRGQIARTLALALGVAVVALTATHRHGHAQPRVDARSAELAGGGTAEVGR